MKKKLIFCGVIALALISFLLLFYKLVIVPWSLSKIEMLESGKNDVTKIELYFAEERDLLGTAIIAEPEAIEQIVNMLFSYKVDKKVRYPQDNTYGETNHALKVDIYCGEKIIENLEVSDLAIFKDCYKEGVEWVYEVLISYIPEDFYPKLRAIYDANVIAP